MTLRGVRGVEVHVTVNDEVIATEYPDPDTPDTNLRATRFIEARAGAQFSIDITYAPNFKHRALNIKQQVWVDGQLKHDAFHRTAALEPGLRQSVKRPNRGRTHQVFRWKVLVVTEDDAAPKLNDEQRLVLESTGLISVQLFRKEELEQLDVVQEDVAAPESKLKGRGIYLSVDTGEAEPVKKSEWKVLDTSDSPCAEFKFQYRSRLALRELRIMPVDRARERQRRQAHAEREEREKFIRGIKRERDLENAADDADDYCVIDEEASIFRPPRRAWIDVDTDGAPIVYSDDPGWSGRGLANRGNTAEARPPKVRKSGVRKKPKSKASVHFSDDDSGDAGRSAIPMMSGGQTGRQKTIRTKERRPTVSPDQEGGLHTGGDGYAENGFSGDDEGDNESDGLFVGP